MNHEKKDGGSKKQRMPDVLPVGEPLPVVLPIPNVRGDRKAKPGQPPLRAKPRQEIQSKDVGIACKRCGCRHHATLDVRRVRDGRIRRRRECRHCTLQFVTFEAAEPD